MHAFPFSINARAYLHTDACLYTYGVQQRTSCTRNYYVPKFSTLPRRLNTHRARIPANSLNVCRYRRVALLLISNLETIGGGVRCGLRISLESTPFLYRRRARAYRPRQIARCDRLLCTQHTRHGRACSKNQMHSPLVHTQEDGSAKKTSRKQNTQL